MINDLYTANDLPDLKSIINNTTGAFQPGSTLNVARASSQMAASKMDVIAEEEHTDRRKDAPIPDWHTFKLCLMGKAFSGKKTTAQMIKEHLGDQINLFVMEDIIREAFNYVNPEKKEEVPDPKTKGKGKAQDPVNVDIFSGQDVETYKDLANTLLKQVHVSIGSEKLPGKDISLLSVINDDILLINLLIEKIKLSFKEPPSSKEA
jgi:hypothetical protein